MTKVNSEPRILCVDDEQNVLEGLERILFDHFEVHTALSGADGLELLVTDGPFAVVISDMRMPEMDGATFLAQFREKSPATVRILLTGYTDIESAISAVNDGNIFRFLCKPCPQDVMVRTIEAAVKQYHLITAEKELLEKTLRSAVQVLSEVLSIASPVAFSRSRHIRSYVAHMIKRLHLKNAWKFDLAAMLCQIGCIAIPSDTLLKVYSGQEISTDEQKMVDEHPLLGHKLLAHIPRLEQIALMIRGLHQKDATASPETLLGTEILSIAIALDRLVAGGKTIETATRILMDENGSNVKLLAIMFDFPEQSYTDIVKAVYVREMQPSMVLDEDVRAKNGNVVIGKEQELNPALIAKLQNFSSGIGLKEPIRVRLRS